MKFKKIELNSVNSFLSEEIPVGIGIKYAPNKIRNCFSIKQSIKNGMYNYRKKE